MALGDKLGQCGTGVAEYVATLTNCLTGSLGRQWAWVPALGREAQEEARGGHAVAGAGSF